MLITVRDPSLVLLIGPSGSGKSTFGRRHFRTTEVLSSDFCRALVSDDESNQDATNDAFELLHAIVAKRLRRKRTTVIDATNVQASAREPLRAAAKNWGVELVAIVFALPEEICQQRNQQRPYRQVKTDVIHDQVLTLMQSLECLAAEGFNAVFTLRTIDEADNTVLQRTTGYS